MTIHVEHNYTLFTCIDMKLNYVLALYVRLAFILREISAFKCAQGKRQPDLPALSLMLPNYKCTKSHEVCSIKDNGAIVELTLKVP